VFRDTKADAPDAFSGRQDNNLDIVQGTLGLNRGHTKLRVVMTFKNLSKTIAAPANFLSYLFYWANPAGDSGPNAVEATVDKSGKVTYSDGNVAVVNGNTNYTQSATTAAAGKFGHGPNGALEIDVPLTELHLRLGQALTQEVGSAGSGASSPFGSLSGTADSDGPKGSHKYKLGQPTCIDRERHK
jgi:hypothetical protein